jgi:TRAP-type C4-dicarboxylate transport system permease large subunit
MLTVKLPNRCWWEWIATLPVFIILLVIIVAGNSEKLHAQLLKTGGQIWQEYFLLRADIGTPSCNVAPDIESELNKLATETNELDMLFDDEPFDREAARQSLENTRKLCLEKHQIAQQNQARVTMPVKLFRGVEKSIAAISLVTYEKQRVILVLLIFICAINCSIRQHHIAFKPVITLRDQQVSSIAQFFGNGILLISAWTYRDKVFQASAVVDNPEIFPLLILGFGLLTGISLYLLIKPRAGIKSGGNILHALLSIPLYIIMALCAAKYFFLTEGHAAGLAIFFNLLIDQAGLFLNIALYIWAGMLLKQTNLGEQLFNIFKPWRMSPEVLAFVAIVVMAVPTAYTGASGIIIIAMGSIVYKELRRVGARRQLALAATAMTGSAGVVLKPCLLVVLIAALNKEVVTDQLFEWGLKTFLTTILVFWFFTFLTRQEKMRIASVREALPCFLQALIPLIPYGLILIVIYLLYVFLLNAYLDEFSAPVILPVMVLGLIIYEKLYSKQPPLSEDREQEQQGLECSIRFATSEASIHIGALLLLMGLSFVLGGVIERSEVLNIFPHSFDSIWVTLGFLVVVLIGIGMIMDPFGAVVLVSGTVAQIAYKNGIHPIHFWMMTLVAFELGYLSPPVALNHLLTKQMVGHDETIQAAQEGSNFWYRHEKILLPLATMSTTLLLVSIVPILVSSF